MATLYARTTTCIELFANLARLLENGPEQHRNKISVTQVENEAARLKVWAGNLGALRTGHAALDHRLRDSTAMRDAIIKTLDKIEDVLRTSCLIVKGDRVPLEDAVDDCSDADEYDDSADSDGSSSAQIDSELVFNLTEITDLLSELHRLSFRIRNPGVRATAESTLKARLHRETDLYTGEDVFERHQREDQLRIKGLVFDFHLQSGHQPDPEDEYLVDRAGMANATRRRSFAYWKAHAARLARVSREPQVLTPAVQSSTVSEPHRESPALEMPTPTVAPTNAVSEQRTATSATEATKFAPNLDVEWDSKSQISYMSTTFDTSGVYSHPPPPHIPPEAREFTCPYCHLTCPVRHFKGQAWRKHVLQDFQPYFCTYKECPEDTALYADRIAWKEHERLAHRRVWHCFEHPSIFGPHSTVRRHLVDNHQELNPSQIESLLGMATSERLDERSICPFCGSQEHFEPDFTDHLACHMEKFAMITSPLSHDEDETAHGSGSGVAMSGGAESRLALSSLSGFDSHANRSENDGLPPPGTLAENQNAESDVLAEFRHELRLCTMISLIGDEPFVVERRLFMWYRRYRTASPNGSLTNAGRMLRALSPPIADIIPDLEAKMGWGDDGVWLKVFTILLQLGKGSYIEVFWRLGILDSHLPVTPAQLQRLWDEGEAQPEEPIKLTDNFLRLQRQLCATIDGKHWLPEIGTEDDVILPITIKQFIGGSTFKAHIPLECFRADLDQRHPGNSDLQGREVFDVALTIWNKSSDIDERKLAAYKALNVAQNRGFCRDMEQCYGSWRINGATYVLREWKYSTLENMFEISKEESSFVWRSRDIRTFWMHLLALTGAVSGVKNLEGCALEKYSWHININPSAVFFNSPFKESWRRLWGLGHIETAVIQDWPARKEQIPFTSARGDSVAYGGPELDRPGLEKVTQSSDMWSLGCVISETATWVTLGNEGIVKYRSLRASLSPSGCFHDGTNVSKVVLDWHSHLRSGRQSDEMTCQLLDWVESDMLLGDPADRISADGLWRKFDTIRRSS